MLGGAAIWCQTRLQEKKRVHCVRFGCLAWRLMGASRLPTGVLSLKRFLLRQQVLALYRDVLRTLRQVTDESHRQHLRDWARNDFKVNIHHVDEETIRMLIYQGRKSLQELKSIVERQSAKITAEEDAELKELVIQSLENSGVLAKIRSQLRASVFLALDEANTLQKRKPLVSKALQDYLSTRNGKLIAGLVREFLQYFELDSTLSVYDPESHFEHLYLYKDRHSLAENLGIPANEVPSGPLLDFYVQKLLAPTGSDNCKSATLDAVIPGLSNEVEDVNSEVPSILELSNANSKKTDGSGDGNRDPFFDDPLPEESIEMPPKKSNLSNEKSLSDELKKAGFGDVVGNEPVVSPRIKSDTAFTFSPLGSLKDAPPLVTESRAKLPPLFKPNSKPPLKNKFHDDDYEEDFLSSASVRSDLKTGSEHSIEEDIEENLSAVVEDLLSNDGLSEMDEATTDHSISQIGNDGADYLENVG